MSVVAIISLASAWAAEPVVTKPAPESITETWNLQDADIRAVVQTISQLTGKNFIIDPRVQGKVSLISAKPMTMGEMYQSFLSMLQVLNYVAIPAGSIIKIVPAMDARGYGGTLSDGQVPLNGDAVVVRILPINHVSAEQLVPILRPLMLDWGNVNAYLPSNSIVLAGSASNVAQLVTIAETLDKNNGSTPEVVKLKYADATKLATVIQSLQTANNNQGKISNVALVADPNENALLVSGNDTNRASMIELIQQLDTQNSAGGNNTAVIHLNYLTAKNLAPLLTKLAHGYVEQEKKTSQSSTTTFGVGDVSSDKLISVQAVDDDNAIILSGPHQVIQSLQHVVSQIDTRPQEVLVQAIVVKIDETALSKLGVQWGMGDPRGTSTDSNGLPVSANMFMNGVGFIKNGSFGAIITALKTNGDTDILSTPSVLVLNNQKAMISDGKNVGMLNRQYATNNISPAGADVPFNTFDRKDVTLSLNVTPQIAPDNTVRLKIQHKDDSLASDANSQDGNPTINTSKIDTTVLVNSGDILVLGGLIDSNDTVNDAKIPILGDIPVLGRLFHNKTHSTEKKNLMVFIRPIIINNEIEAQEQSMQKYSYVRYQQMRKRNGMGLSADEANPVLSYTNAKHDATLPPPF